jgi:hypothetical protein
VTCTGPIGAVEVNNDISAGLGCELLGTTVRGDVAVNPGGSLITRRAFTTVITGSVRGSDVFAVRLRGHTSVGGNVRFTGTGGNEVGISEGTVNGNIEVDEGTAVLNVLGETVGGNILGLNISNRDFVLLQVDGDVVGGNVEVGKNTFTSPLEDRLEVSFTSVAGNLLVFNNNINAHSLHRNEIILAANHVDGNAELLYNTVSRGVVRPLVEVSENVVTNTLNCLSNVPAPVEGEFAEFPNTAKHKLGQCQLL